MAIGSSSALQTLAMIIDRQAKSEERDSQRDFSMQMQSMQNKQQNLRSSLESIRQKNLFRMQEQSKLEDQAMSLGLDVNSVADDGEAINGGGQVVDDLKSSLTTQLQDQRELASMYSESEPVLRNSITYAQKGRNSAYSLQSSKARGFHNMTERQQNSLIKERAGLEGVPGKDFDSYRQGFLSDAFEAGRLADLNLSEIKRKKAESEIDLINEQISGIVSEKPDRFMARAIKRAEITDGLIDQSVQNLLTPRAMEYRNLYMKKQQGELTDDEKEAFKKVKNDIQNKAFSYGENFGKFLKAANFITTAKGESDFADQFGKEYSDIAVQIATNPKGFIQRAEKTLEKYGSLLDGTDEEKKKALNDMSNSERATIISLMFNESLGNSIQERVDKVAELGSMSRMSRKMREAAASSGDMKLASKIYEDATESARDLQDLRFSGEIFEQLGEEADRYLRERVGDGGDGGDGEEININNYDPVTKEDVNTYEDAAKGIIKDDDDVASVNFENYTVLDKEYKRINNKHKNLVNSIANGLSEKNELKAKKEIERLEERMISIKKKLDTYEKMKKVSIKINARDISVENDPVAGMTYGYFANLFSDSEKNEPYTVEDIDRELSISLAQITKIRNNGDTVPLKLYDKIYNLKQAKKELGNK